MDSQKIYSRAIGILDNFFEESNKGIETLQIENNWKSQTIYQLYKQSSHLMFCLLSNSEESKFRNDFYITEMILYGSLGRILRDIYVSIIYLKTEKYTEYEMQLCWNYQITLHKLNIIKYSNDKLSIETFELQKLGLKNQLDLLNFNTKQKVFQGREEKLLTIDELAEIKEFDVTLFNDEFKYFSQFSHSTAFANSLTNNGSINLMVIADMYDRIVAYYIGIITESIETLTPNHHQISELNSHYKNIIKAKWTKLK